VPDDGPDEHEKRPFIYNNFKKYMNEESTRLGFRAHLVFTI